MKKRKEEKGERKEKGKKKRGEALFFSLRWSRPYMQVHISVDKGEK